MSWRDFATWVHSIPLPVQWGLALAGAATGLMFILAPERVTRGLRRWLLVQLKWSRRPSYRRMLKLYGWLLFVTGVMLMLLLLLTRGR